MGNDKTPGNDGITKEFYVKFWDFLKELLFASIQSFLVGALSASQKRAIMKLIVKKDRDKRFLENWRPNSLLNVYMTLISKALGCHSEKVIATMINENQVSYVSDRFINEGVE